MHLPEREKPTSMDLSRGGDHFPHRAVAAGYITACNGDVTQSGNCSLCVVRSDQFPQENNGADNLIGLEIISFVRSTGLPLKLIGSRHYVKNGSGPSVTQSVRRTDGQKKSRAVRETDSRDRQTDNQQTQTVRWSIRQSVTQTQSADTVCLSVPAQIRYQTIRQAVRQSQTDRRSSCQ